jgi:hypothetical protein
MKLQNLENYGVQEMDAREMQTTEGGIFGLIILFAIGLLFGLSTEQ